jgi:hypothetical protein
MGEIHVRRTWRAAAVALISSMMAAGALLSSLVPAQAATARPATPVPPAPSAALAGTWVNTNHATNSVVDVVVATGRKGITVDGFGACSPTPCEWGKIPGTVFGPNVSAKIGTSFAAQWNFGFARTVLLATYSARTKVPTLRVQEFTTFTDGSGRANYTATETFIKGAPVKVTKTGVSAADYPLGDPVSPLSTLPAIWVNTATTGGLRAVILSLGPGSGLLQVHAYGFCSPVPCNWGTVTGITFGQSVSATAGGTFLAPYKFGFANKLLDGRINKAGTRLTVQTWTEFTDHSKRSNYVSTETFVPLR